MSITGLKPPVTLSILAHQTREKFEAEAHIFLAVQLYETGRLTSRQAAKLVGMSRRNFLTECRSYANLISYGMTRK